MSPTANLSAGLDGRITVADDTFAAMLTAHSATLRSLAHRLTNGAPEGDDLVQDTLLRCWSARRTFSAGTNFAAWSRTIMRNRFLSSRRRDRFHGVLSEDAFDRLEGTPGGQDDALLLRDVAWALQELSAEQRGAVLLSSDGATTEEGALHFAITQASYKTRVFRGRQRLRQLIEKGLPPGSSKVTIKFSSSVA